LEVARQAAAGLRCDHSVGVAARRALDAPTVMLAKLIALVLPLGLDTFAVAAALGMIGVAPDRRRQITLLFTVFEAGMPLIGLAVGAPLGRSIGSAADYLAVAILIAFGLYTLFGSHNEERVQELVEPRGLRSLALGVSISLDELAIGFTLGLLRVPVVPVIALIAVQTIIVTQLGLRVGHRLSDRSREHAEQLAGVALTVLGGVLLAERLLA
jgi:putative Mn2+ efflux pump MntP